MSLKVHRPILQTGFENACQPNKLNKALLLAIEALTDCRLILRHVEPDLVNDSILSITDRFFQDLNKLKNGPEVHP